MAITAFTQLRQRDVMDACILLPSLQHRWWAVSCWALMRDIIIMKVHNHWWDRDISLDIRPSLRDIHSWDIFAFPSHALSSYDCVVLWTLSSYFKLKIQLPFIKINNTLQITFRYHLSKSLLNTQIILRTLKSNELATNALDVEILILL